MTDGTGDRPRRVEVLAACARRTGTPAPPKENLMLIVKISTASAAAVPGGPTAATFTLPGGSGQVAAARVEIAGHLASWPAA